MKKGFGTSKHRKARIEKFKAKHPGTKKTPDRIRKKAPLVKSSNSLLQGIEFDKKTADMTEEEKEAFIRGRCGKRHDLRETSIGRLYGASNASEVERTGL